MNRAIRVGVWVLVLGASTFMAYFGVLGVLVRARVLG